MGIVSRRVALAVVLFWGVGASGLHGQGVEYIRSHYTKQEQRIAMRDGTKLFTAVYVPKDTSQTYPILLTRTPYGVGPYGSNSYPDTIGPSQTFGEAGYAVAYQDVRGRNQSAGQFVDVRPYIERKNGPKDFDESSDAYDTVEWLLKNVPNNNGRVGIWGISYPGFYAAMGAIGAHPAVKAVSPQAPVAEWFLGDDFHHNGALFLAAGFDFLTFFGRPGQPWFEHGTPDAYQFFLDIGPLRNVNEKYFKGKVTFWEDLLQHGTYDDFWKARAVPPRLKEIAPAMMTVGGWFDAEDVYGSLHVYQALEQQNPGIYNAMVMGPWSHGGWAKREGDALGDVTFGSKTSLFYRDQIEFPFFEHYLKGKDDPKLPEAYVFVTGKNQWRRQESWPPKNVAARSLYFRDGGELSFDFPTQAAGAFDEYVSDPAKPVPFIEGVALGVPVEYMVADQRFASRRPDVLAYRSDRLGDDVTVAGPITASLYVSSTGTDSDWVVKLIDVYPDDHPGVRMGGYQQLVRGEPMRAKFRNSFEKPEPLQPGRVTKVEFVLPDVFHAFRKGHRVMVQIQSSWFPLMDRNPQKFVDIYSARESDFQKATQRVYRSKEFPSAIRINVLK